jgi:choline dehydrogenase-like flavoprotein
VATIAFGGNSNCWWGQVPRFHPSDFRLAEDHGVGASWPIGYDDLEPFYGEVEAVMEIAGGGNEGILPRTAPFPFPPHRGSRSDAALAEALPGIWVPVPTARANGGSRATCCANGVCHLCPVDAKFTIQNGIDRFPTDGVRLLTGEVRSVVRAAGMAGGVVVATEAGEVELRADLVALGTNAIGNAAILLRSGFAAPALGRYLHEQTSDELLVDIDRRSGFGGTSITGHCYGHYDGPHRAGSGAVLIENYNMPGAYRREPGRWTERLRLKLIAEDLPQAENRVTLADGEAHVVWIGHSAYGRAGVDRAVERIAEVVPFAIEGLHRVGPVVTEAHIQGTHRMGSDPALSVVDDGLRLHEASNVVALGAGCFPTSSASNPTLTLSALALRAGRML